MTLLKKLGIDRYTAKFKEWIRNKFIAKGSLKTINNQSIEGEGNIEVQADAEIIWPETIHLNEHQKTNESRVFRAFYNIQNDEFTIIAGVEREPVQAWFIFRAINLGEILNISIIDGEPIVYSCVAKVTQNAPIANVQFDYLDTHYTLTWNADTQSWDVTKTPINTGADWNAQEGEAGYIENRTHYLDTKTEYSLGNGINKVPWRDARIIKFGNTIQELPVFENNLEIQIVSGPPVYIKYTSEDDESYIKLIDNYNYFTNRSIEFYYGVKTINNIYLPNTVLKTTPQTLSDEDKNQALANLGIDPVVWKYMCNPYELSGTGGMVPEELRNIIEDEDGALRKIASKLIVMNDYDNVSHIITDISHSSITSKWDTLIYSHGSFNPEP